jgi:hypothetical protein
MRRSRAPGPCWLMLISLIRPGADLDDGDSFSYGTVRNVRSLKACTRPYNSSFTFGQVSLRRPNSRFPLLRRTCCQVKKSTVRLRGVRQPEGLGYPYQIRQGFRTHRAHHAAAVYFHRNLADTEPTRDVYSLAHRGGRNTSRSRLVKKSTATALVALPMPGRRHVR